MELFLQSTGQFRARERVPVLAALPRRRRCRLTCRLALGLLPSVPRPVYHLSVGLQQALVRRQRVGVVLREQRDCQYQIFVEVSFITKFDYIPEITFQKVMKVLENISNSGIHWSFCLVWTGRLWKAAPSVMRDSSLPKSCPSRGRTSRGMTCANDQKFKERTKTLQRFQSDWCCGDAKPIHSCSWLLFFISFFFWEDENWSNKGYFFCRKLRTGETTLPCVNKCYLWKFWSTPKCSDAQLLTAS